MIKMQIFEISFYITALSFLTLNNLLKASVTNFKNKEVTANSKPQTLGKNWSFKNPKPSA